MPVPTLQPNAEEDLPYDYALWPKRDNRYLNVSIFFVVDTRSKIEKSNSSK
jgi:hypothetical protein